MIIHDVHQGSPEWLRLRHGLITASDAHRLLTPAKRETYARQLAAEKLTKASTEQFVNDAMQRGIECEPVARARYELVRGVEVTEVGFVSDADTAYGYSPDGFVGEDGLIEIKCPEPHTHIANIADGPKPEWVAQCQFGLWVTGRDWCDFVSWDDRVTACDFYVDRLTPDSEWADKFKGGVAKTLGRIEELLGAVDAVVQ
ncbi:MAG: lambda exonuclease family protein [Planctomycetota bacterium]